METITLTGRSSRLSLIQIDLVKAKIKNAFPELEVIIKPTSSLGDRLQNVPLQTVEGYDFFTEEVFQNLVTGEADIAVHSLKDMSAAHLFGGNHFAVTDRDEPRDIAIFNPSIEDKLKKGETIIIGTCSPRREVMATQFLKEALPRLASTIKIETKFIRGNVDTRLQKLNSNEYDGIILAIAGINRLLKYPEISDAIKSLLHGKKLMVLPLLTCTPAPCQGAIVAESLPNNEKAIKVMEAINDADLFTSCIAERKVAHKYGTGCDQRFGVTTVSYANQKSIYAAGQNEAGKVFEEWIDLPKLNLSQKNIWFGAMYKASTQKIKTHKTQILESPVLFVANDNAVDETVLPQLFLKRVWTPGIQTWKKLAHKGVWVEGCTDGLGLEAILSLWKSPTINVTKDNVTILTHEQASLNWKNNGWNSIGTYRAQSDYIALDLHLADIVFWASANQYKALGHSVKKNAVHVCASGETRVQLIKAGVEPVIFPTIQSFQQWKKKNTH